MRRGERGVMAVMVGILLFSTLGFGALAIDVGALVQERRELQNGADAAALAVAKDCATGSTCGPSAATAKTYADLNADDGKSDVAEICGTGPGLAGCASPPTVPSGAKYVQVRATTREASSGGAQITYRLAQILTGSSGHTVTAGAVAAWGGISKAPTIPLTFSKCEYDKVATLQTGPPFSGSPSFVYFHGTVASPGPAGKCKATPSGGDLPGGFGWLKDTTAPVNCDVDITITTSPTVPDKPGDSLGDCTKAQLAALLQDKTVLMPIYNDITGTGSNINYQIVGFAAVYITAYRFSGVSWAEEGGSFICPGQPGASGRCIRGYFTKFVTSTGQFGGPDMGAATVKMVG